MTVRFMLDTDSVSFALRGHGGVGARIIAHRPSELAISSITLTELRYGAERRKSKKLHRLIDVFTSNVSVLPFDEACGAQFGKLASDLIARGTPIGDFDTLIAAHAMELHLTLVTNNGKHFNRIAGLNVENWV
jgi:tRNA(fMet)-specific endonuclease VapC